MINLSACLIKQRGVAALAVGLILLFAATIITIFAAKVGIQEQRISGNEYRSKLAFEAAQAGLDYGKIYLQQNMRTMIRNTGLWKACDDTSANKVWKEDRLDNFCEDANGNLRGDLLWTSITPDSTALPSNASLTYRIFYLVNAPGGNIPDPSDPQFGFTILSEGASDIPTDGSVERIVGSGQGYAFMKMDVVTKSVLANPPKSPLIAASMVGGVGGGNFTIIGNPNGAARGAPLSVWSNNNVNFATGSLQTCQYHEFYKNPSPANQKPQLLKLNIDGSVSSSNYDFGIEGTDEIVICDNCECAVGDRLSSSANPDGIDILDRDSESGANRDAIYFPTDCSVPSPCKITSETCNSGTDLNLLFRYFFGICRNEELSSTGHIVRDQSEVITSCGVLNANSGLNRTGGLYWIDDNCSINGQDIGSPFNPVLLIVNGGSVNMNGNVNFYGLLYVIGNPNDEVNAGGSVNFYGAVVTEKKFDTNGTFDLIYNEKVLRNLANNVRTLQSVPGSWADYTRE